MAAPTIIAQGSWKLHSDNTFQITSANGKTVTCAPVAQYNYPEGTQLSHDVDFVTKGGKFTGFKARNEVEPGSNEPTAESAAQAKTGPLLKLAMTSLKAPKPVPPSMLAALKNLAKQPQGMRSLDVKNKVDVPRDPKERLAIYDALPKDLRQIFVDACAAYDKRRAGK